MADYERRPILSNGEHYVERTSQWTSSPMEQTPPRTPEQAQLFLRDKITQLKSEVAQIPTSRRVSDIVLTIPVHPKYVAKSYYPGSFFSAANLEEIGSRRWTSDIDEREGLSKMYFVRASAASIDQLEKNMNLPVENFSQSWQNDICKIEDIRLLTKDEQFLGFNEDWDTGRVEFVLHPMDELNNDALNLFTSLLTQSGVDESSVKIKIYSDGPIFATCILTRNQLNQLAGFNPLRTAHPLKSTAIPEIRGIDGASLPTAPDMSSKSQIIVGVFDGGTTTGIPHLDPFVTNIDAVKTDGSTTLLNHGTAVTGLILYGALNHYEPTAQLPTPELSVRSYRVLPLDDPLDIDLWQIIDVIEETVPQTKDIKVYNLSLGPEGHIEDDEITRFTFALDRLSYDENVQFIVAVGNDGSKEYPYNRIQSPSDSINNVGVGAWTLSTNSEGAKKVRAPYSCVGMGREGAKLKPDVVAFGGCTSFPIHTFSCSSTNRHLWCGTSFATPLVTRQMASIIGRSPQLDALTARALVIHNARHPNETPDHELGHGCILESATELLQCSRSQVSAIFQGSIYPKTYASLPIFLPDSLEEHRKMKIDLYWTIACSVRPRGLYTDDYTSAAIEDRFFPHVRKFVLSKDGKTKTVDILLDTDLINDLVSAGWQMSKGVKTASGNQYTEQNKRKINSAWDTVVRRKAPYKTSESYYRPYLEIHAMDRGKQASGTPIKYSVVVTIQAHDYSGDLYNDIRGQWHNLTPITLRTLNEIMIPVK